jgi:hypothetical protein
MGDPWLQATLLCFFFTLFVVALASNVLIIMVIHCSPNLYTPVCFFLVILALLGVV